MNKLEEELEKFAWDEGPIEPEHVHAALKEFQDRHTITEHDINCNPAVITKGVQERIRERCYLLAKDMGGAVDASALFTEVIVVIHLGVLAERYRRQGHNLHAGGEC